MKVLTVYLNGSKMGTSPRVTNPNPPKRKSIKGWSSAAARRNSDFLRSVDIKSVQGHGYALSLTLKRCPPTPELFHAVRRSFIERLRRIGFNCLHWVVEWQSRGVPHLHLCVYFKHEVDVNLIIRHWLAVSSDYGSRYRSQYVTPIYDAAGWLMYVAKHTARGIYHYQRSADNIPPEWSSGTGRVWGYSGQWPKGDPLRFSVDPKSFYRLRRIFRNHRVAEARSKIDSIRRYSFSNFSEAFLEAHIPLITQLRVSGALKPYLSAKRCLRSSKRHSEVFGMNEWLSQDVMLQLLGLLVQQGGIVSLVE